MNTYGNTRDSLETAGATLSLSVVIVAVCYVLWKVLHALRQRQLRRKNLLPILARAMAHGLPLHHALRAAVEEQQLAQTTCGELLLAVAQEIEAGVTLSQALERHLRRDLPPHFLAAVRAAEADDQLPAVLPVLTLGLNRGVSLRMQIRSVLVFPVVELWVCGCITAFSVVFICPKLSRVLEETTGDATLPSWTAALLAVAGFFTHQPVAILVFVLVLVAGIMVMSRQDDLVMALPVIGSVRKRLLLLELVEMLAAMTAGSRDLVRAAEEAMASCRSSTMKRRLGNFVDSLRKGMPWADAWEETRMGKPMHNWILRNAAAREQPAAGFLALRDWMAEEVERQVGWIAFWLEPCMTCFNAAVVALVVFGMWQTLFRMTMAAMDM